jgi:hypothetical protein
MLIIRKINSAEDTALLNILPSTDIEWQIRRINTYGTLFYRFWNEQASARWRTLPITASISFFPHCSDQFSGFSNNLFTLPAFFQFERNIDWKNVFGFRFRSILLGYWSFCFKPVPKTFFL